MLSQLQHPAVWRLEPARFRPANAMKMPDTSLEHVVVHRGGGDPLPHLQRALQPLKHEIWLGFLKCACLLFLLTK